MQELIRIAVRTALQNGSRKVRVTWKQDAIRDLSYLLGMKNSGIIDMTPTQHVVVLAVMEDNDWGGAENRTMVIELTDKFNDKSHEDWFISRLRRAIEKIAYGQPPKS